MLRMPVPPPIARPPWTRLGKKLESLCRKALYDFALLDGVKRLAIALSGGKDSLTLLFLLCAISGRGFPSLDICAVHVGGEFSCGAGVHRQFLHAICTELGIPLLLRESTQKRDSLACYPCSRERRKLIFEAAREYGAETIAFGHHRDDSIQTLMMNLLHKGEFAANLPKIPMQEYGVVIIRPLLYIPEEEIRAFAKLYSFARISCQCPIGQSSLRKQTEQLIVKLQDTFPNARDNLARAALLYGSNKALTP